jgi:excinuclease ABC subunit A
VVVIEHNLDVIKTADWLIDMGPEGGSRGGMVVAEGTPEQIANIPESHTGTFLRPILEGRDVPVGPPQPLLLPPGRPLTKAAKKALERAETAAKKAQDKADAAAAKAAAKKVSAKTAPAKKAAAKKVIARPAARAAASRRAPTGSGGSNATRASSTNGSAARASSTNGGRVAARRAS